VNPLEELLAGLPQEDIQVEEVRVGPFLTAVRLGEERKNLDEQVSRVGLASTIAPHGHAENRRLRRVGGLESLTAGDLAQYLLSDIPLEACIGMATLNAVLEVPCHCFQEKPFWGLLDERCRGNRVAVVGHFPFVERLRKIVKELRVLELKPRQGDLPASRAKDVLPRCQVVVVTATILMNGTYQEILPLCGESFAVMVGPSTPASPVLFARGMDMLAGSMVIEPEGVMRAVSQGATYRDLTGVRKWVWLRPPFER
jgi:uncharacterized protein (DUF4213/DUF364 family)